MSNRTGPIVSFVFRTVVVTILLAIAVGIAYWLTVTRPIPASVTASEAIRSVDVLKIEPESVSRTWLGYGSAEALDSADVPSEVSSIVEEIPERIEVGRVIAVGDLIARLDAEDFQQQAEIAERALRELATREEQLDLDEEIAEELVDLSAQDVAILQSELARVEDARASGAATQREVDLVRQRLIQARSAATAARERRDSIPLARQLLETQKASQRATREIAQRNVERCQILSPIAGVLESVDIEIGERVDPMMRVARIVSLERMVVPVRLPSSARQSVHVGDPVVLRAGGAVNRVWNGGISRISPVDDTATRTMTVFVEPETQENDEADAIAPGTFVSASVLSPQEKMRPVVPRSAVRNERIWFVDGAGVIDSMQVDVAFPIENPDGSDRRLVLNSDVPRGALIVMDAGRTPPIGTKVTPVLREMTDESTAGDAP